MKRIVKLETGEINVKTLLSSRTYYNYNGFNLCVYCHQEVESYDWYIHRCEDNIDHWVAPTVCNCELAQQEVKIKKELLSKLIELDNYIDSDSINRGTLKAKIEELTDEFVDKD